ncbi:MAG TPA: AbrB/MazE/SpoVT family DNA-binding domain-containing protein [Phenylobacterium sp.]|nr:AbrB/MazE/SpoVT family DNA-binding domain-containing protein [Phenylobacterium sp.]
MRVAKWGNSLAIRLPKPIVEIMGIKEGDDVQVTVTGKEAVTLEQTPDRLEFLERVKKYQGLMPPGFKFNRDEANERG